MSELTWDSFLARLDGGTEILKRWLASMLQEPEVRRPYLFLWSPERGTGRSSFYQACNSLTAVISSGWFLGSSFNGELDGPRPLITIDPLCYGQWNWWVREQLEAYVYPRTLVIHRPYRRPSERVNTTSWVQLGRKLEDCLVPNFLALRVEPAANPIPKQELLETLKNDTPRFLGTL
jgi:hypothetical protein